MEIKEFIKVNGIYIDYNDEPFNPECHIAIIEDGITYDEKIKVGCEWLYDEVIRYKVLTKEITNDIYEYISYLGGRIISKDTDFDKVMREEKLQEALGNVRIIKLIFETKKVVNARDCRDCEC